MTIPPALLTPSRAGCSAAELDALMTIQAPGAGPLEVAVTRGPMVESVHQVACAVTDASGTVTAAWGDVDRPVYPRSAIKPIQALPVVESGAAEALAMTDKEIALACASHGGEPVHVEAVRALLARLDLTDGDLECGSHLPSHVPSADAMLASGEPWRNVHNNCSGKHTAMLATAVHMGEDVHGYSLREHPVQQRVIAAVGEMSGCDLAGAATGIDGCSLPTLGLPLSGLATAMARFGRPDDLPPGRAAACRRIAAAMAAEPLMVAGHDRACTAIIEATGGGALVKTGAEGVYAAALPEHGLGVALKVADGAGRASQAAIIAVLRHLGGINDGALLRLRDFAVAPLHNRRGLLTGEVRMAQPSDRGGI